MAGFKFFSKKPKTPEEELYQAGLKAEKSKDFQQASKFYQQAVDKGHLQAQTKLGLLYDQKKVADHLGYPIYYPVQEIKAEELLSQAAKKGDVEAMGGYARILEQKLTGSTEESPVYRQQAIEWYQKAAKGGHPDAAKRALLLKAQDRFPFESINPEQYKRFTNALNNPVGDDGDAKDANQLKAIYSTLGFKKKETNKIVDDMHPSERIIYLIELRDSFLKREESINKTVDAKLNGAPNSPPKPSPLMTTAYNRSRIQAPPLYAPSAATPVLPKQSEPPKRQSSERRPKGP